MVRKEKEAERIKHIDKTSVHRICSGQVILDLATGVKELVENSLDAGATCIEIKLKDYGAESFEVADNGCGVAPENYQALTLKYHTSKISEFSDLQYLTSFGFRGEALSSLCALGDLTIITRTKNEPMATQLQYDHSGSIISQKLEARPVGTTVCVSRLFKSLPVRYKEFNKNIRREYSRLVAILHAYALMTKGVRLVCTHITGKNRTVILKTQGTSSIKDNIITVFGTKVANCLEPVNISLVNGAQIEGFISKPGSGSGRASGDRQFYYINNRPVELPKVAKLLNDLYRSFNSLQYPMALLNFTLPTTAYDVNVTPDKRKVFLHAENELLVALKESLERVYAPDKYTYSVQKVQCTPLEKHPAADALLEFETQRCLEHDLTPEEDSSSHAVCIDSADNNGGAKICHDAENQCQILMHEDKDASPSKAPTNITANGADLDLFQCKIPSKNSDTDGHCKLGLELGEKGQFSESQHHVFQSKLTGFLTNSKRPRENESVLSETPFLKNCSSLSPKAIVDMQPLQCHGSFAQSMDSATNTNRLEGKSFLSEVPILKKFLLSSTNSKRPNENKSLLSETPLLKKSCSLSPVDPLRGHGLFAQSTGSVTNTNRLEGKSFISEEPVLKKFLMPSTSSETDKEIDIAKCHSSITMSKDLSSERFLSVPSGNDVGTESYTSNNDNCMDGHRAIEICVQTPVVTMRAAGTDVLVDSSPASKADDVELIQQSINLDIEDRVSQTPAGEMISNPPSCTVEFNLQKLRMKFAKVLSCHKNCLSAGKHVRHNKGFHAASMGLESNSAIESGKEAALAAATRELEITFNKADFRNMKVLGQFNLGFILAKLHDDIFIVDQHASDEKYNFERLSKTTVLNRQPLLRPLPLDLSVAEEVIVMTHLEVFRKNGFDFVQNTDGPPGQRLCLTAVPFSQKTTFGAHDVQELVSLLMDEPSFQYSSSQNECIDEKQEVNLSTIKNLIRPSRIRAMLASRACRSSIMIGDALSKKEMEKILAHLSELDSPWNCPHGRPTMRHLVDMTNIKKK